MNSQSSRIARTLQQKFEALHEAFVDLNAEVTGLQLQLNLDDNASRGQLDALTRTLAFCDQLHMSLTLMRDDLRALDPQNADSLPSLWTDQLDECLEEWLRTACQANTTIH